MDFLGQGDALAVGERLYAFPHLVPPGLVLGSDETELADRLPLIFGAQRNFFDRVSDQTNHVGWHSLAEIVNAGWMLPRRGHSQTHVYHLCVPPGGYESPYFKAFSEICWVSEGFWRRGRPTNDCPDAFVGDR